MWGEARFATELYAIGLRVGTAVRCTFGNAATFQLRGDAEHGKHKLGKLRGRIDDRLGNPWLLFFGRGKVPTSQKVLWKRLENPGSGGSKMCRPIFFSKSALLLTALCLGIV